jgi:hypothetical protein
MMPLEVFAWITACAHDTISRRLRQGWGNTLARSEYVSENIRGRCDCGYFFSSLSERRGRSNALVGQMILASWIFSDITSQAKQACPTASASKVA